MLPVFTPEHVGGSGPPLLLIHGFTDTWHTWKLVLGRLEREFTVIAPTLPGHAGGPPLVDSRPALDQALELLTARIEADGGGPIAVCGNSLGGYIRAQARRARLGVVGGRARSRCRLGAGRRRAARRDARADSRRWIRSFDRRLRTPSRSPPRHRDAGRRRRCSAAGPRTCLPRWWSVRSSAPPVAPAACRWSPRHGAAAGRCDPGRLACPIRIVWGSADAILPWPRAAAGFRATMPQADWVVLDGVGHAPSSTCHSRRPS